MAELNLDQTDKLIVPKGFKEPKFTQEDNPHSFLEESSFKIIFPKYRERQIKEAWPLVEIFLKSPFEIACELDLVENTMLVKTTKKTWDPWAIINARDLIKCLSRSVPYQQCIKVFDDETGAQFMKIDGMVRNKKKFRKRRDRLIGPDSATLKALEVLTGCYILVAGKTVTSIGPYKGLREVFKFVNNTMNNIHPVYMIKEMMIKKELAKDPKMEGENWNRFLPNFKTDRSNRKQPSQGKKSGKDDNSGPGPSSASTKSARKQASEAKSPFPPKNHFTPSKIDKQLESGEYFMKKDDKKKRKIIDKDRQNKEKSKIKKMKKMEELGKAPQEKNRNKSQNSSENVDVKKLKKKLEKV